MSQVVSSDELSNSVSKLVELNKQITEAREDIKVLSLFPTNRDCSPNLVVVLAQSAPSERTILANPD